jgi:hypothetical protein
VARGEMRGIDIEKWARWQISEGPGTQPVTGSLYPTSAMSRIGNPGIRRMAASCVFYNRSKTIQRSDLLADKEAQPDADDERIRLARSLFGQASGSTILGEARPVSKQTRSESHS